MKIYVGPYDRKPAQAPRASMLDTLQPDEMMAALQMAEHIHQEFSKEEFCLWTNHIWPLDEMSVDDVIVLTPNGPRPLSEHPEWPEWIGGMTPGEFYSYVGYDWPKPHHLRSGT